MKNDSNTLGTIIQEQYFTTLIYYQDLDDAEENNIALNSLITSKRNIDAEGIIRSNVKAIGSWHSQVDLHTHSECRWLVESILSAAQHIFDQLDYDPNYEPAIDNMWANINPKYGFNRNHIHPNTLWSGVYYVQVPDNAGSIFFSDPRIQSQMYAPRYNPENERKPLTWSEVYYEPIAGRLIVFPSWLQHEVEPNMSTRHGAEANRVSISFNVFQRKKTLP